MTAILFYAVIILILFCLKFLSDGVRLNPEDEKFILEKVLEHHPEKQSKVSGEIDYLTVRFYISPLGSAFRHLSTSIKDSMVKTSLILDRWSVIALLLTGQQAPDFPGHSVLFRGLHRWIPGRFLLPEVPGELCEEELHGGRGHILHEVFKAPSQAGTTS